MTEPILSVREFKISDIEIIAAYWLNSEKVYLENMGVDINKLPSKEQFSTYLTTQFQTLLAEKDSYCIIWQENNIPIGHSNTRPTFFGEEAFMHLHLWNKGIRRKGIGYELVKLTLPYFFENLKLKNLYCEPFALNPAPNKTIQKAGFELISEHTTISGVFNFEQPVGELNNKYFSFINALYQYLDYTNEQPFEKQKNISEQMLATQQKLLPQLHDDYQRQKKRYTTTLSLYKRNAILFTDSVISKADFEKEIINALSMEQEYKSVDKQITNTSYQINDATNKLQMLAIQKIEKERELAINLFNAYYDLQDNIKQWIHKYVFVSPIDGQLDFLSFLKTDDYVQTGQELFKIVPSKSEIVEQLYLPETGSGKVVVGQNVIIKLDNYPYTQFGSINGKIINISLATNQQTLSNAQNKVDAYLVDVSLPNGLQTNYGNTLNYHIETKGTGEIITDNRKLLEKLFDNLKYSLK